MGRAVILINDFKIANVDYCKYIGLYIDQDLKWTIHIDQLCGKLQKLAGIFFIESGVNYLKLA